MADNFYPVLFTSTFNPKPKDCAMAYNNDTTTKDDREDEEPQNWSNVAIDLTSHPKKATSWFKGYLRDDIFIWNFYRTHVLYFIIVIMLTSVVVYGEGLANDPTQINGSKLRYVDALFICASAMTTTGTVHNSAEAARTNVSRAEQYQSWIFDCVSAGSFDYPYVSWECHFRVYLCGYDPTQIL
jgi:hypothetical protein